MAKFLLWLILLVLCWPLALLGLVLYPFVWLLLLPFRLSALIQLGAGDGEGLELEHTQARAVVGPRLAVLAPSTVVADRGGHAGGAAMKVGITGGTGFLGAHLARRLLERGAKVRVLDNFSTGRRSNVEPFAGDITLIEGDIRDAADVGRAVDGVYGGEMSAHHYFREFSYADSGMIPWLLVAELISTTGKPLSELVGERMAMYPASGEINRKVEDAKATLQKLHDTYAAEALSVDDTDGYSFEFADWRFNIRMSNTEPVVRLNVESRGDAALMKEKTAEVLSILEG